LDILIWTPRTARLTTSSSTAQAIFSLAASRNLNLALAELPVDFFDLAGAGMVQDRKTVTCLRSVLMKPEHLEWVDRIWTILDQVTGEAMARVKL